MISLLTVLYILVVHYVADFIFQTDEQAKGKSSSWKSLLDHTMIYSFIWFFAALFLFYDTFWMALPFAIITLVAHTATDYVTSRWVKSYFSKGDHHNGFVVIGFDQLLHFIQLLFTYQFLVQFI